jgi:indole-3-acetate monooxygenase
MANNRQETALLDVARAMRPRILAAREAIETARRLPAELAGELARAGFFRIALPAPYGGFDLAPPDALAIFEELARADASVAWCVWNGNTHWTGAQLTPEAARTIHADPAVITANSTRAAGRAEAVPGGYRVSGRWSLVSGCELAAWLVLLCVVEDADVGEPPLAAPPASAPELRFMLLPADQCEIIDTWTVGGLRGTGSHDVVVRDRFVPIAFGSAFTDPHVLPEPRYRLPAFSRVIPGLGVMALGIARTAIDALVELAAGKQLQRSSQTLRENRGAQSRLAEAEALVGAARLYLFDAVERLWRTVCATGDAPMLLRAQVRLAVSHAVASAVRAVDLMYATAGASALYTSSPLERAFRDVHAMTQHIGVDPRIMEATGRVLFGLEPDTPWL